MNDIRLIDANALTEYFKRLARSLANARCFSAADAVRGAAEKVASAPTIDAVAVVHGRWVRDEANENWFACSVCKGENGPWNRFAECTYKFCPWCGAKMDGGAADGN